MEALRALAEPSRYRIVRLLARGPCCTKLIAAEVGISSPAASQHLRVLRDAGLVTGDRRGYFVHYRLERGAFEQLQRELQAELWSILPEEAGNDRCCRRGEGGGDCGR